MTGLPKILMTCSLGLVFHEPGKAFQDVNGSFMLRLNRGSVCFSVRFLVKPVRQPYERLLKGGKRFLGYLCLLDLALAPFFQSVSAKQCTMTVGLFGCAGYRER